MTALIESLHHDMVCRPDATWVPRDGVPLLTVEEAVLLATTEGYDGPENLRNALAVAADLGGAVAIPPSFDAVWCRWVASFVPDVRRLASHAAAALRSSGTAFRDLRPRIATPGPLVP